MFEYNCIKQLLQYQLPPMDFVHVSSPFLVSNDKAIPENDKIHNRKLQKLIPSIDETIIIDNVSHDPNRIIRIFLDQDLSESDESLLIAPILRLWLTVPRQKLKCKVKSLKYKSSKWKSSL